MTKEIKNKIHGLAVKQIVADYKLIKKNVELKGETLYGFAIGIVGDITGFFSAGNTIKSLSSVLKEYKEEDFHPSYFWCIPEWKYEGTNSNTLYEFLATFIYDIEDNKYDSVIKDYENTLIKALKTCDKKRVFGKGKERESIIIYLQYADATDEDIDDFSSEKINPKNIHLLFKERWNKNNKNLTKIITEKIKKLPNKM